MRIKRESRIGQTFGNLEIVRVSERASHYIVKCNKCAEDAELNGAAEYEIASGNLYKGILPCACSKSHTWNLSQYLIRCERRIKSNFKNLSIVSVCGVDLGVATKIELLCSKHNKKFKTSVHVLLRDNYNGMCLDCEREFTSQRKTKDICENDINHFPEGSYVWRSSEKRSSSDNKGAGYFKYLHCGVCSEDVFVTHGLCEGIFKITGVKNKPCRCSNKYKYTDEMLKFIVEEYFYENNYEHLRFVGIKSSNRPHNGSRDMILSCDYHGIYKKRYVNKDLKGGMVVCPSCSERGGYKTHKQGYFYVLEISHIYQKDFIGFGISNYPEDRLSVHRNELSKHGYVISNYYLFTGSGKSILQLESEVKREFEIISQGVDGFIKEALAEEQLNKLLDHINKYVDRIKKIDYNSVID